ncbi:MAG: UvrD-helicase domain-containing protein [Coraliomargarita sp.]
MNALQHIAISASAGSGKTYQLTNRFIYLLHLTEQPERIIALTFTRTAAGEFFHKIIEKLCAAASDADIATELSTTLGIEADCARYHTLLALLIGRMHQLNLQTLDSFFFRVVSSFALELGLSGNLNLLDESSEPRVRNEVRDRIVHHPGELNAELNEFWHAFKQATYGQEQRSVERIVANFIDSLYALYLAAPDQAQWGQPNQIWPKGCPWQGAATPDWDQLADNLLSSLPADLSKSQLTDFETTASKLRLYGSDEKTNALLNRALEQADEILAGSTLLKCGRGKNNQLQLSGPICNALADSLRAIIWHHLHRALQNTQGVHRILKAYHDNYDQIVRRPGRLAFADLTHLLSPDSAGSPLRTQTDSELRELMDFRLDGQYDHWLFDEFQDTSRPQWEVVQNLIDEILQDASGQRSLFYVGDTKQCLYLWRNSDDRLFHDIQAHYSNIERHPLSVSWRSAPAILDAVNEAFDDPQLIAECFSADAAARWQQAWQVHAAAKPNENQSGFACWIEAQKDDSPTRNEHILNILTELNPIERGMSVGVLVRKNSDANEVADFLRENSSLPVHTGSAVQPATDNAAGTALLSMLRLAAHPGDQLAEGHLRLIDVSTDGYSLLGAAKELRSKLLNESHEDSLRWAAGQVISHLPEQDQRHHQRLDLLIEKARAFDSEENRDADALIDFLQNSTSGECSPTDAIIVETIHKSKGLEYDVVILVNEDKTVRSERRISPLLDTNGKAEWILEPIKKELMLADHELNKLHAQSESQHGFGNLCTLYVAMTRAKRGLYMISDLSRASNGSTVHYLKERLGKDADDQILFNNQAYPVLWSSGDPQFYQDIKRAEAEQESPSPVTLQPSPFKPAHPRLTLARPSGQKSSQLKAGKLFDLDEQASEFGSAVHDAFEQIEWLEMEGNAPSLPPVETRVEDTLQRCFDTPDIQQLFTRPPSSSAVWRERNFSVVDGDQFINGTFDRVHIHYTNDGSIERAEIIDFKTDRIAGSTTLEVATERHRPQLELYRKALACILGLAPNQIALKLLFTDTAQIVTIGS